MAVGAGRVYGPGAAMKKIGTVLLCAVLLTVLCLCLASCGECKHKEFLPGYEIVGPTCETDGYYVYTCKACESKVEVAPRADDDLMLAYGHTPDKGTVTVQPTCTEAGEKTFTCKTCEASLPALTEAVAAKGHTVNRSQYVSDGEQHWNTCSVCGAKEGETPCEYITVALDEGQHGSICLTCEYVNEASVTEHELDEGDVVRAVDCAEAGLTVYSCLGCDFSVEVTVDALAHDYDTETYVTEDGKHFHVCSACGAADPQSVADCDYQVSAETLPTADSCLAGERTLCCTVCEDEKTERIPSEAPHRLTATASDGTVTYTCPVCEASFTSSYMRYADGTDAQGFTTKVSGADTKAAYTADGSTVLPTVTEGGNSYYTLTRNTVAGNTKAQMEFYYAPKAAEIAGITGVASITLRGSETGMSGGWNLRLYNKVGEDGWSNNSTATSASYHDLFLLSGGADGKTVNDSMNKKLLTLSTDTFTRIDITFTVDDAADTIILEYYVDGVFVRKLTRANNLAYDTPTGLFLWARSTASSAAAPRTLCFDDLLFAYTDDGRKSFLQ